MIVEELIKEMYSGLFTVCIDLKNREFVLDCFDPIEKYGVDHYSVSYQEGDSRKRFEAPFNLSVEKI